MDVRTYGQIPPVFYRTSSPSGPLPKKEKESWSTILEILFFSAARPGGSLPFMSLNFLVDLDFGIRFHHEYIPVGPPTFLDDERDCFVA